MFRASSLRDLYAMLYTDDLFTPPAFSSSMARSRLCSFPRGKISAIIASLIKHVFSLIFCKHLCFQTSSLLGASKPSKEHASIYSGTKSGSNTIFLMSRIFFTVVTSSSLVKEESTPSLEVTQACSTESGQERVGILEKLTSEKVGKDFNLCFPSC